MVKQLLKELEVTINTSVKFETATVHDIPNALTIETIENAHKGIGLDKPIENISDFITSL